jgi:hypothetical protein
MQADPASPAGDAGDELDANATDPRDPALQGEGNYTAARNHRGSVKRFLDEGKVEAAAEAAAPRTPEEERDMKAAEDAGLSHGRH